MQLKARFLRQGGDNCRHELHQTPISLVAAGKENVSLANKLKHFENGLCVTIFGLLAYQKFISHLYYQKSVHNWSLTSWVWEGQTRLNLSTEMVHFKQMSPRQDWWSSNIWIILMKQLSFQLSTLQGTAMTTGFSFLQIIQPKLVKRVRTLIRVFALDYLPVLHLQTHDGPNIPLMILRRL